MYSVLCALRLSQQLDTHVSTCLMPSQLLELPHQQWQLDSRKEDAGVKIRGGTFLKVYAGLNRLFG